MNLINCEDIIEERILFKFLLTIKNKLYLEYYFK